MRFTFIIPVFFLLIILSACGSQRFHSRTAFGYNLGEFDSFALIPSNDTLQHLLYDAAIFRDRINDRIIREMKQRDYELDKESPELLVLVHLMYAGEGDPMVLDPVPGNYQYYPRNYTQPTASYYFEGYVDIPRIRSVDIDDVPYTPESIVIDVINAGNNLLVWRGWTGRSLHPNASVEDINLFIDRFFRRYPVAEKNESKEDIEEIEENYVQQ